MGANFDENPPAWDDRRRVPVSVRTSLRVGAGPSSGNRASFVRARARGPEPGNIGITCRGVPMAPPPDGTLGASQRRLLGNRCDLPSSNWPTPGLCLVFNISSAEGSIAVSTPMRRELLEMASTRWVGCPRAQRRLPTGSHPRARQAAQPVAQGSTHPERAQGTRSRPVWWWVWPVWITAAMPRCSAKSGPTQAQAGRTQPGGGQTARHEDPSPPALKPQASLKRYISDDASLPSFVPLPSSSPRRFSSL